MGKRFKVGLFIGRFQPFHKGHLSALRFASSRCRRLVIGIGSSNESGTRRNPIPAAGRIRIIREALKESRISTKGMRFLSIPDFGDNEKWFSYIIGREPELDVVFSRHWLVKKIFREHGITVVSPPWHRRGSLAATKIRKMIKEEHEWKRRVPKGAVREISKHAHTIRRL